ncbi:hypothetical protein NLJ89_g3192 [Agrocybe chaxingu]|uniref:Uncharacterized protein n=1 Tax=Agrocybe chaxingu TaxID=84603 RepID=A0A9W8MYK8_9AGAR|nr:hypothetical protein NLJ89_g3192 [Agrocybe chaxingu]
MIRSMDKSALEHVALSPHLYYNCIVRTRTGLAGPRSVQLLLDHMSKKKTTWNHEDQRTPGYTAIFLVPGGRHLVTSGHVTSEHGTLRTMIDLWDLGLPGNRGRNKLVATSIIGDADLQPRLVVPTPDGNGLRLISATADRIYVHELLPDPFHAEWREPMTSTTSLKPFGDSIVLAYQGKIFYWNWGPYNNLKRVGSHINDGFDDTGLNFLPHTAWSSFHGAPLHNYLGIICGGRFEFYKLQSLGDPKARIQGAPNAFPIHQPMSDEFDVDQEAGELRDMQPLDKNSLVFLGYDEGTLFANAISDLGGDNTPRVVSLEFGFDRDNHVMHAQLCPATGRVCAVERPQDLHH